jgi:hypothetical protein
MLLASYSGEQRRVSEGFAGWIEMVGSIGERRFDSQKGMVVG